MKLSVVIPTHNEADYITDCLDSLMKQNCKPDEIIIVDNNCTDQTIPLAQTYPVKIIREKKQGMIYARNTGFDTALCDVIARCDADTIVPENWVKRIKNNFKNETISALSGPIYFHNLPIIKEFRFPAVAYAKLMKTIQDHETLLGPNMALTKEIWERVKNEVCLNDKKVHEDIDLAIHIQKYGRIKFDPELVVWTSSRRMRNNPFSFFVEYPIRLAKTLIDH